MRLAQDHQAAERDAEPGNLVHVGEAHARVGDHARASQYFALALENGADPRVTMPKLVNACIRDKQYRAAIFHAQGYLTQHPQDTSMRLVLAVLHTAMGDAASARHELTIVLRERPTDAEAHYALAVVVRDQGDDPSAADSHFREYLALRPDGLHADEARGSLLKVVP